MSGPNASGLDAQEAPGLPDNRADNDCSPHMVSPRPQKRARIEAVTREVEQFTVGRNFGHAPRKIRMSLPRVRWAEKPL